ncbi:class I SAM-dependent methyltransferase [Coralloluteibacterium thermophilus]|uniref:Class I SAM-dependent methyltransferase n=1 Tax=Coralloluteibacterium thermophilum TaxID=2707049 RepID=A0ABV9NN07_9GAMM
MPSPDTERRLREHNRRFYDALWRDARLVAPERFNTWPIVAPLAAASTRRLEVAPGLRPRLPIEGTCFADISLPALRALHEAGGEAVHALVSALPFGDAAFDLVAAMDIVEHVDDDEAAFAELARVCAPGGCLLLSVPLHMSAWTPFDEFVGHRRRYAPEALLALLTRHGFEIERSAAHGMQPSSSRLLDLGMWFLTHQRKRAMWWYNRVGMPLSVRFQAPLDARPGLIDVERVDTVLLVCRRTG